jgi:hypothetical protein
MCHVITIGIWVMKLKHVHVCAIICTDQKVVKSRGGQDNYFAHFWWSWLSQKSTLNNYLASQEMFRLLWNTKLYYHIHNSPPMIPTLNWMNLVQNFPHCFPKIHSNISLPFTPTKIVYAFLTSPMRATFPTHHILLDLITLTIIGED